MILHAKHYMTACPIAIAIADGVIKSIATSDQNPVCWVAPAFFDPQINGCLGISFNSSSLVSEQVRTVADTCRGHGIGGFLPTLITSDFGSIQHGFATLELSRQRDSELARRIPGYHLEGPYLSDEDGPRGAHPREHIRDPDWGEFRRFQEAANGNIRMVTIAPERPGAIPFIERLTESGVVAAIGHTAANADQIQAAIQAGAKTSTHLGNGSHALLPRHDNYIWAQLAADQLWASLISDGHHLPPAVVKCLVRAKGIARTLLTCDAGSLACMPPGKYRQWNTDLEVLPSGRIVVAGTPFLAGSGHFTDVCVANVIRFADISLGDAVEMASIRPRQLLGLPVPTIETNRPAELVVFDWQPGGDIHVREVI